MANQDDARRSATSLPDVTEDDGRFAFRGKALARVGLFPAVLLRLAAIDVGLLEEPIVRAWRIRAPKRLAATLDR